MFISLAPGLVSILLFAAAQSAPAQPEAQPRAAQEPAQKTPERKPTPKRAPAQKAAQPQPTGPHSVPSPAQTASPAPTQKAADTAQLRPQARGMVWATERLGRGETVTEGDLRKTEEGYPGLSRSTAQRVMAKLSENPTPESKETESA